MKKIKILHIISSLGCGGAEQLLYDFLQASHKERYHHTVITLRYGHQVEALRALGIEVYVITGLIARYDLVALFRLYRLVKKIKPDLIHASLWLANIVSRLVGAHLKIPVICHQHDNCHYRGLFRNTVDRATASLQTVNLSVSAAVEESYRGAVLHDDQHEVLDCLTVIPNGINCQNVIQHKDWWDESLLKKTDGQFIIGAVGRLQQIKRFDLLIKAYSHFLGHVTDRNIIRLCIVGDGDQRESLEKLAHDLGIAENIIFAGFQADARSWYQLFDLFVISSDSEGVSLSLLEALCWKVPVITTTRTPQHEVITHGRDGILVPTNDIRSLTHALVLLYQNRSLGRILAANGYRTVNNRFSITAMAHAYEALYEQVLRG